MTSAAAAREALKARLAGLHAHLRSTLADLQADEDALADEKDSDERVSLVESEDVLSRLEVHDRVEISALQEALARLDEGSWGTCTACGEPVGAKRLHAIPWAATCVDCAEAAG